jgi:hypothetical protein
VTTTRGGKLFKPVCAERPGNSQGGRERPIFAAVGVGSLADLATIRAGPKR